MRFFRGFFYLYSRYKLLYHAISIYTYYMREQRVQKGAVVVGAFEAERVRRQREYDRRVYKGVAFFWCVAATAGAVVVLVWAWKKAVVAAENFVVWRAERKRVAQVAEAREAFWAEV